MTVVWLAAFVVFLAAEALTVSLTSIWFAGGALTALAVQVLGAGIRLQLAVFVAVSFLLFFLVRPAASRYVKEKKTPTNVDGLIGRRAVVKETVDAGSGSAVLAGETWLARAYREGESLLPGSTVIAREVSGAELWWRRSPRTEKAGKTRYKYDRR